MRDAQRPVGRIHECFQTENRRTHLHGSIIARLWTHRIFSTKNRFPFFSDKKLRTDTHAYLAKMLREQDCETLIVKGVEDHVIHCSRYRELIPLRQLLRR